MTEKLKNASTLPRLYYGLHFVEGIAEYKELKHASGQPYRVFVSEQTMKNMDPTYEGRPVFVQHGEVNLETLNEDADGYVVDSFYNKVDGKHWVRFLVTSDRGHEAIRSGWKLSNSYLIKLEGPGGVWHGVDYLKEVTQGEYDHLAIVPNPRYQESVVLTPEQFKQYNHDKELELTKLANSIPVVETKKAPVPEIITKGVSKMKLDMFKKQKVENSEDFENTVITLKNSQREVSILQLANEADAIELEKKNPSSQMANGDHKVKIGDQEMTVNELTEKYTSLLSSNSAPAVDDKKKEVAPQNADAAVSDEDKKKNADAALSDEDKKKNADAAAVDEEKKKNSLDAFEALKNAPQTAIANSPVHELSEDKISRGKARYGS